MRHGLFIPAFDELASPHRLIELAQAAERAQWDGLFLWDHLTYSAPVRELLDPFVCLSAIATETSRLALGPLVTPITRRSLAVVARQATTLDLLSKGRFVLGIGLGDDPELGERSRMGEFADGKARGRALTESVEVLRRLMSGSEVTHDGEFYRVASTSFRPVAREHGTVPFWLAARWPHHAPLARAATYDGVVVIQLTDPADVAKLRSQLASHGADLKTFEVVLDPTGSAELDPSAWSDAGVTWLLHREGPFEMRYDEVLDRVSAGPVP
jgi:alkanesulfonate monooxygenase SsuD/methylene tetrahydromethanopterin reductase-like flavin-dependent oxidoreductase (luciferase family)